ncbi:MAG: acyltransferase, partial [Rhodoblastus sp.]|nr:acyltransferase [Rhodoblastus sp.]
GAPAAGYLGVDMFFVVSGFVIARQIVGHLEIGSFSFGEFYWRRARRIIPSAYVVMLVTAAVCLPLLTSLELAQFKTQVWSATTFTANIALWRQADYFDAAAAFKPLLHMWSLSVEQHFYLLHPFLLWATSQRFRGPAVLALLAASAASYCAIRGAHPAAAFYLTPTRIWEPLSGAAAAIYFADGWQTGWLRRSGVIALAIAVLIPFAPNSLVSSGLAPIIVCFATAATIVSRPRVLNTGPASVILSRIGDISYPLYLVHWPLFSLLSNVSASDPVPLGPRLAAVVTSFALAGALHVLVEMPCRRIKSPTRTSLKVAGVATCMLLAVSIVPPTRDARNWEALRMHAGGLAEVCEQTGSSFVFRRQCQSADQPDTIVWGDSFARQLLSGLVAHAAPHGFLQATRSSCGPVVGMAPFLSSYERARDCMSINQSVLDYITANQNLKIAILSSMLLQYFCLSADARVDCQDRPTAPFDALAATVRKLESLGLGVILVGPMPSVEANTGICVERLIRGLPMWGETADCGTSFAEFKARFAPAIDLLKSIQETTSAVVVWPHSLFCDEAKCRTHVDGKPLLFDTIHATPWGAELVAPVIVDAMNRVMRTHRTGGR